jgi:hypothetical protein
MGHVLSRSLLKLGVMLLLGFPAAENAHAIQPVGQCVNACDGLEVQDRLFGTPRRHLGSEETPQSVCEKVAADFSPPKTITSCTVQVEPLVFLVTVNMQFCCTTNGPEVRFKCENGLRPLGDNFACTCSPGAPPPARSPTTRRAASR